MRPGWPFIHALTPISCAGRLARAGGGMVGLSSFARLDQADTRISDSGLDPATRETLASHVRQLIVASPKLWPRGALRAALRTAPRPI